MSEALTFQCPNCGAAIEPEGVARTIKCNYCGTQVVVPREIRDKTEQMLQATPQVYIQTFGQSAVPAGYSINMSGIGQMVEEQQRSARRIGCIITAVVLVFTLGITAVVLVATLGVPILALVGLGVAANDNDGNVTFEEIVEQVEGGSSGNAGDGESSGAGGFFTNEGGQDDGFGREVLTFGSAGSGPGSFDDARHIAVAQDGTIYVGDYQDGRVQAFDAQGTFQFLIKAPNDTPMRGMAVNREGEVLVVTGGAIYKYNGSTGEQIQPAPFASSAYFDDLFIGPDGNMVSATFGDADIVVLDRNGTVTLTIPQAIQTVTGETESTTAVAVDGQGNIYGLGTFNESIFVFSPQGTFQDRFGTDEDEGGQFISPYDIAVDLQNRLYVTDFGRVLVYSSDGTFVDEIDLSPGVSAYGLNFDSQGNLYVAARDRVIKFEILK